MLNRRSFLLGSTAALLTGVAEQVYALNLADSKPTDAGLAPLAGLKNLATLHLERSSVTDAGSLSAAKAN